MDYSDSIDQATFEQILEMDDDGDDREFSKSIVLGFFEQAENTFKEMEDTLAKEDEPSDDSLKTLSSLGHFLKGSSATLGLTKVKDYCEKIQNYGDRKDDQGVNDIRSSDAELLRKIKTTVERLKLEYDYVEVKLKKFYHVPT